MVDLSRFNLDQFKDVKNLDVGWFVQTLSAHRVKVIAAGFAVLAVIGGLMIFNGYRARATEYQQQIKALQDKMDAIGRYKRSQEALKGFFASLPGELENDRLITQLTDYAAQNNVDIINYAPGQNKSEKLYDMFRVRLNVSAGSFSGLLAFVRMIERSPYALRVESFSTGVKNNAGANAQPATAEMFISSVRVKK